MMRKREAYQKAAEQVRQDQSFPRALRRIVEETIHLRKQCGSNEASSITDLADTESTLPILATKGEDSTTFFALELGSEHNTNDDWSVKSNYCSSHRTPEETKDEALDQTSTEEAKNNLWTLPEEAKINTRALPKEVKTNILTPPKEAETENPPLVEEQDEMSFRYRRGILMEEAEVNTKYKTVDKKIKPVAVLLPEDSWQKMKSLTIQA